LYRTRPAVKQRGGAGPLRRERRQHVVDAPSPAFSKVVRVFGMTALTVGLTLAALIIYALIAS
jgi:hypothetical protein